MSDGPCLWSASLGVVLGRRLASLVVGTLLLGAISPAHASGPLPPGSLDKPPALVLIVVVDQLRADALTRHQPRLLAAGSAENPGGLRWLTQNGAWFPQAQHDTLHAMTGPGHATIATGAWPYRHGVVLNVWQPPSGAPAQYCVRDLKAPLVGATATDIRRGVSPRALLGTTIGDALKSSGGHSQVITVAIKDRAAVLLGGHRADLAIWLERPTHRWITSRYYRPDGTLPAWVTTLNAHNEANRAKPGVWKPLGQADGRSTAMPQAGLGKRSATVRAIWSPAGDKLTTDAAVGALKALKSGKSATAGDPNILAVSYSPHDLVGHSHGHNAREMEEMLVSADRSVATLLKAVATHVRGGLRNTLVVFTADHGAPPAQSYLRRNRLPNGIVARGSVRKLAEQAVTDALGKSPTGRWISYEIKFEVFIDRLAVRKAHADLSQIQKVIAKALRAHPDMEWVFTRDEALAGRWPAGRFGVQAARGWHPRRSADVVAMPRSFVIPENDEVVHFTGYAYDRTVPLILAGPHIQPGVYPRAVPTTSIAPTVAFLLGVVPPALSEGRPLHEIFGAANPHSRSTSKKAENPDGKRAKKKNAPGEDDERRGYATVASDETAPLQTRPRRRRARGVRLQ